LAFPPGRPSVTDRYATSDDYAAAVRAAAESLVAQRFMLADEDEALRQDRHQRAEAIRDAYEPGPWWAYAVLTAFFVSYGLGRDLNSVWAGIAQFVSWVILAGAAWAQWCRRKTKPSVGSTWRMTDAIVWIVTIGFTAATLAVLFGGPYVLAALGVPLPHAICGLAVGLMLIAAIPLGSWSVRRKVARVEAGE